MGMLNREDYKDFFVVSAYGPKLRSVVIDATKEFGVGAKQSFKEECDINRIMAKYQKTGAVSWLTKHEGSYGDVSSFDFLDAQLVVAKAKEMFADLPSSVRSRFSNDPAEFLFFMQDTGNAEEAIRLGLAVRKPVVEEPEVVPPVVVPAVVPAVDPGK